MCLTTFGCAVAAFVKLFKTFHCLENCGISRFLLRFIVVQVGKV